MSTTIDKGVFVNGQKYYDSYEQYFSNDGSSIKIGQSTIIKFVNSTGIHCNITFKFSIAGDLKQRISDLQFIFALIEFDEITIGNQSYTFKFSDAIQDDFQIENYKHVLKLFSRFDKVLKKMNVKDIFDVASCNEKSFRDMNLLSQAILDRKDLIIKQNLPSIATWKIANLVFYLVFEESQLKPGRYRVYDFFNHRLSLYSLDKDNKQLDTTQFAILNKQDLTAAANISYEYIVDDIKEYKPNVAILNHANKILLDFLFVYDATQNKELLKCALESSLWLKESGNKELCSDLNEINYLQTIKRNRKLSFPEKETLHIIIRNTTDVECKIGALLLLDEKQEAEKLLTSDEKKIWLDLYPIAIFF